MEVKEETRDNDGDCRGYISQNVKRRRGIVPSWDGRSFAPFFIRRQITKKTELNMFMSQMDWEVFNLLKDQFEKIGNYI